MYNENDELLPHNLYAWTKLGGESCVKMVKNHLIIRTSFGESEFPYEHAYINLISSKDYVDIISPMILKAVKSELIGILNIGTLPKSIYEFAKKRNNVTPIELKKQKNFSLNTTKYEKIFNYKRMSDF